MNTNTTTPKRRRKNPRARGSGTIYKPRGSRNWWFAFSARIHNLGSGSLRSCLGLPSPGVVVGTQSTKSLGKLFKRAGRQPIDGYVICLDGSELNAHPGRVLQVP